ncbi:aryl-alcohol dehydrogenase-like predicted oxidoreductase [Pullulanibacillus pueri]|uniref:Putative oxidoreductase YqkF n=1 Tax=Pullulanibacillus pueri TaxID=1437324 RepID=A0A8J2ZUP8_9BACL|nr:aldo/keto reductase [Pullulanibacillus pueri]MBM7681648.1 aryl-alcohol dehydrogenase-like predicted oxidoreductase [Pullulanibacillus pueri]GGH79318.1 putative oxidoreductase YqkF [Pullulanibacillus pueri]
MKFNKLGSSDLTVSEIGLGTMSLPANDTEAIHMIQKAIDDGMNFLDTADLYEQGRIESLLGQAVKGRRDDVIIATKGGNHWEAGKQGWYWDPSKKYIKNALKASLKRLNLDYVDLYQLHGGTIEDPIDETIEAFEELKQEGLIRWYGISSIRHNVIREYVKRSSIVSVMMQYSILDRRPEEEMLDFLAEKNVSVIARGPVAKGLLSDKGISKISEKGYLDYTEKALKHLIKELKENTNRTRKLSHTAIRYVLNHPAVATAIPGASRMEQLEDNLQATSAPPLSETELKTIRSLSKANKYTDHRE